MGTNPHPVMNRLLGALPDDEYKRLQPHLESVQLSNRRTLCEAGDSIQHTCFLRNGMESLLDLTRGRTTVELAMVRNEGMLGIPSSSELTSALPDHGPTPRRGHEDQDRCHPGGIQARRRTARSTTQLHACADHSDRPISPLQSFPHSGEATMPLALDNP